MIRIFSNDPGEQNSAYSVTEISSKGVKLIETGMITDTIVNLTSDERVLVKKRGKEKNLRDSYRAFKRKILDIHKRHAPTHFVAERFQTRGIKGRSAETVSMMNAVGMVIADAKKCTYRLIMAAQWKNWANKIVPLEELYDIGQKRNLTNHTVDTICIAIYEYVNFFGKTDLELTPAKLKNIIRKAQHYKVE